MFGAVRTVTTDAGLRARQNRRMFKAQDGRCWLCGAPMLLLFNGERLHHPAAATREHVIPRSAGGTDALHNIRLTHRICNQLRGSTVDPEVSRSKVRGRLGPHLRRYLKQRNEPVTADRVKELLGFQRARLEREAPLDLTPLEGFEGHPFPPMRVRR